MVYFSQEFNLELSLRKGKLSRQRRDPEEKQWFNSGRAIEGRKTVHPAYLCVGKAGYRKT